MLTESKTHYKRNLLISIIISEVLIISAFILSPGKSVKDERILYDEPVILFNDIPQTVQSQQARVPKPDVPPIYISDKIEAFEPLEDVSLSQEILNPNDNGYGKLSDQNNILPVRSVPRQIFEVVPADGDMEFNGKLQLSLKINEKGQVVGHRVLYNTLDCTDCLKEIIKAAYRSKWEPAMVNGNNTDYWVVKSYTFN